MMLKIISFKKNFFLFVIHQFSTMIRNLFHLFSIFLGVTDSRLREKKESKIK